jgi:hypothetical protein
LIERLAQTGVGIIFVSPDRSVATQERLMQAAAGF